MVCSSIWMVRPAFFVFGLVRSFWPVHLAADGQLALVQVDVDPPDAPGPRPAVARCGRRGR